MHRPNHPTPKPHPSRSRVAPLAAALPITAALAFGCAHSPAPLDEAQQRRVEAAERELADDPALEARQAGIDAALAREGSEQLVDDVELRVGDTWIDEHRIRVLARVPIRNPSEMRAQKGIYAADTEIALTRLEEAALTRRADLCFPSVEAQVQRADAALYAEYEARQRDLLAWNDDWRRTGLVTEIDGLRFELESRVRLARRAPQPALVDIEPVNALPDIAPPHARLHYEPASLRETVRRHNPSVALRQATAERYAALAERARVRRRPWVDFVDLSYQHRTGDANDDATNGVGGQVAFQIPLGARSRADVVRYQALVREQKGEARELIEQRVQESLEALADLDHFESQTESLNELLSLADDAELIATRWRRERLAKPSDVAALVDEAFSARRAVLAARERAGFARCTLLAMTGIAAEDWPRDPAGGNALEPAPADERHPDAPRPLPTGLRPAREVGPDQKQ